MGRLIACLVMVLTFVWLASWRLAVIVTILAIVYLVGEEEPWNAHGVQQRSRRQRPRPRRSNTRSMHFGRSKKW